MNSKSNLAGRIGQWSIRHRKAAILGWFAMVIAAFMIGNGMGVKEADSAHQGVGESARAAEIYEHGWPVDKDKQSVTEQVLVESKSLDAHDPEFKSAVHDVMHRLDAVKYVQEIESPYAQHENVRISKDSHAALVTYQLLAADRNEMLARIDKPQAAIATAAKGHSALSLRPVGDASIEKAVDEKDTKDFAKAEVTSVPLTLLILLLTFGAAFAAGVPVILALTAVLAAMGLMGPASAIQPVAGGFESVILLIGLAVGVDYSLFYIRRAREARAAGHDNDTAIGIAASTSGRAVLVSGLTVMVSMAGMYFAGISMFASFATATIIVVAVAMIGSLTVLPALLSKFGDKIEKGRLPGYGFMRRRAQKLAFWSRVTDRVLRRPKLSVAIAGSVLVAMAVPALSMHTALSGTESMSRSIEAVRTWDRVQALFPAQTLPVMVAVQADDVTKGSAAAAIKKFEQSTAKYQSLYTGRATHDVSDNKQVASVLVPAAGDGTDDISQQAMKKIRSDLAPAAFEDVNGVAFATSGTTAAIDDFNQSLKSHMPYVFGFVVIAAFLVLLVTFRSLVIPIKAIVLNVLSVGAAYGLLVAVFQRGWGESLLGFHSTGAISAWLPPFLFVILFGLSMDYHVFILSRIKEGVDDGMSTDEAVSRGIKRTAGVVTSAALIMVGVFSMFGTLSSIDMKQMGVGLAVAVLLDATLIRGVLLPASMKLLGSWNWWLPKRLDFLPQVSGEAEVVPAAA